MSPQASPLALPCTGEMWLSGLNFDVVEHTLSYLEPWSILQFVSSCQAFRKHFYDDKTLWIRVLRRIELEQCIAPYSFPPSSVSSLGNLRRIVTRPYRVLRAVSEENVAISAHIEVLPLDYDSITTSSAEGSFQHLGSVLLPGGRWLLTTALRHNLPRCDTHILCWDTLAAQPGDDSSGVKWPWLPQSELVIEDAQLLAAMTEFSNEYLKVQLSDDNKSVIIAGRFERDNASLGITEIHYHVMTLTWDRDCRPQLSKTASLNVSEIRHIHPDFVFVSNITLAGDFILIEDVRNVAVWNWRIDTIGFIDSQNHNWGQGRGFSTVLHPPHLYIAPVALDEYFQLEIPKFPARGDLGYEPARLPPTSTVRAELLPAPESEDVRRLFDLVLLDEWKPPTMNPGIVVLSTDESHLPEGRRDLQHVITLHRKDSRTYPHIVFSPKATLDPIWRLHHLRIESHDLLGPCGVSLQRQKEYGNSDATVTSFSLDLYPFDGVDFHDRTSRIISIPSDIGNESGSQTLGDSDWTCASVPCLLSGTCLIRNRSHSSSNIVVLGVLHLD
ncbi:hypothetical protein DL93DRAFT_2162354 [Clavulina sp. PMI_390]|nr:hypothetical protein DL93DRAFT_2162354 [Clavulina sp. PMI_390]